MDEKKYKEIVDSLKHGTLPKKYSSTKLNFLGVTEKYDLNKKKVLLRDKKIVVKIMGV